MEQLSLLLIILSASLIWKISDLAQETLGDIFSETIKSDFFIVTIKSTLFLDRRELVFNLSREGFLWELQWFIACLQSIKRCS